MLKIIISIIATVLFVVRDNLCWYKYPNMRTITGEWDGSNSLTMNFFAVIIALGFIYGALPTKHKVTVFFGLVPVWLCAFDLFDRLVFHIYYRTPIDNFFILVAIFLAALTYILNEIYAQRKYKSTID